MYVIPIYIHSYNCFFPASGDLSLSFLGKGAYSSKPGGSSSSEWALVKQNSHFVPAGFQKAWLAVIPSHFEQAVLNPQITKTTTILTDEKWQQQAVNFCRPLLMWEVANWVNYFQLIVAKVLSRPHYTLQLYAGVLISNYEQTWHIHRTILTGTYTAKWQVAIVVDSSGPVFCKVK